VVEKQAYDEMRKKLTEALRKIFRPEFLNRVDSTIVFHALTKDQIRQIVDLETSKVAARLSSYRVTLTLTEAGRDLLADLGYDPDMGARPLRRVIQSNIEDRLSDGLLSGEFKDGDHIVVDAEEGKVSLRAVAEEVGEPALAAG